MSYPCYAYLLFPTFLINPALESILHSRLLNVPVLMISPDGYIRLSIDDLTALPFSHLGSWSDPEFQDELSAQSIPSRVAGFSECRSDTTPAVSLGWGWYVHSQSNCLLLAPDAVRSNVMLIDKFGYDLGNLVTSGILNTWFALFDWQSWVFPFAHEVPCFNLSC